MSLTWCFQFKFSSILISRYLTLLEEWSLCILSLSLMALSCFFLLDLKKIDSVFLTFKEVLFALSQLDQFFKSILIGLLTYLMELEIRD